MKQIGQDAVKAVSLDAMFETAKVEKCYEKMESDELTFSDFCEFLTRIGLSKESYLYKIIFFYC